MVSASKRNGVWVDTCTSVRFILFAAVTLACVSCQHARPHSIRNLQTGSNDTEAINLSLSEFERVLYCFQVTPAVIRMAPEWKKNAPFPPLSPRRAEAAALLEARRLRPDVEKWHRDVIILSEI